MKGNFIKKHDNSSIEMLRKVKCCFYTVEKPFTVTQTNFGCTIRIYGNGGEKGR